MAKQQFTVPSLTEADSEYGALADKYLALGEELSQVSREADALEADIRTRRAPAIRPGVAALLGETVDTSLLERPRRLAELRQRVADLEAAKEIVRRRRDDRIGIASLAACKLVKGEYGKLVAKFVAALEVAKTAYDEAEQLIDALEREGAQIGYMPPARSNFFAGNDNGLTRFVAEAKGAGYV